MTLLVAMFAVAGCVYMLESVFFLNVEVFGVNDSVGERIRLFSVENVEFIFKNWFRLSMRRPSSLSNRPSIHSDEGLTLETSVLTNLLRWLIYLIDLVVDNLF